MNVVIEQLVRKFQVPKPVMLYIMHMFRPKAPPYPLVDGHPWAPWRQSEEDVGKWHWYEWRITTFPNGYTKLWNKLHVYRAFNGIWRLFAPSACSYCTKPMKIGDDCLSDVSACMVCVDAYSRAISILF